MPQGALSEQVLSICRFCKRTSGVRSVVVIVPLEGLQADMTGVPLGHNAVLLIIAGRGGIDFGRHYGREMVMFGVPHH
jgi:hypothetical protein